MELATLVAGKAARWRHTLCRRLKNPTSYDRIVAQCFVTNAAVSGSFVEHGDACDWTRFSGGAYSIGHPDGVHMNDEDDDKLNELRDILRGTKTENVVALRPRTLAGARGRLPIELRTHFDALVADFHSAVFASSPSASLPDDRVLADLVTMGSRDLKATPATDSRR
jgi:hypothetical protein